MPVRIYGFGHFVWDLRHVRAVGLTSGEIMKYIALDKDKLASFFENSDQAWAVFLRPREALDGQLMVGKNNPQNGFGHGGWDLGHRGHFRQTNFRQTRMPWNMGHPN